MFRRPQLLFRFEHFLFSVKGAINVPRLDAHSAGYVTPPSCLAQSTSHGAAADGSFVISGLISMKERRLPALRPTCLTAPGRAVAGDHYLAILNIFLARNRAAFHLGISSSLSRACS